MTAYIVVRKVEVADWQLNPWDESCAIPIMYYFWQSIDYQSPLHCWLLMF